MSQPWSQPWPLSCAGFTFCGGVCIDTLYQCCTNPTAGVTCPGSTIVSGTTYPAQSCGSNNYCGCPAGEIHLFLLSPLCMHLTDESDLASVCAGFDLCGFSPGICINRTSQCCTTDTSQGLNCGGQFCSRDGGSCVNICSCKPPPPVVRMHACSDCPILSTCISISDDVQR